MSLLRTLTTAGLIALTLGGAAAVTTTTAGASERGASFGGLAAGVVGGALAVEAVRPAYPVYPAYYPAYRTYYAPAYIRAYPSCFWTWRHHGWAGPTVSRSTAEA
ncbi:hypothetical protein [Rhizobium mayense]|uniref:BA14K family protein n=1 Tax=Rhizobium mayense TaxID=1312184 RepID=A0ABT7JVS3_9HYPH|nr:hypothetical protein [Rhizobium mayense]MDL2400438.1 hypothetical protein [Rhizobium mayense]